MSGPRQQREAVEAFHQMCRREHVKPQGFVARSWMDGEAGARPNWDYQDLLSPPVPYERHRA